MGRHTLHDTDAMLDATRALLLEQGLEGATVAAIAKAARSPVGTLYHRFRSRDELLAMLWARAARRSQAAFLDAMTGKPPMEAAVDAALSVYDFAEASPGDAQLLAAFRRTDLIRGARTPALKRELALLNAPMGRAIQQLAEGLYGTADPDRIEQVMLAVVDIPLGAIRRHLVAGRPFPPGLRARIAAAVAAALGGARRSEA